MKRKIRNLDDVIGGLMDTDKEIKRLRIDNASLTEKNEELAQQLELSKKLATIDIKTGILNDRGLYRSLINAIKISDRARYGLEHGESVGIPDFSIIFFDFDGFGDINKKEGHIAGDEILEKFAYFVSNNLQKPSDFVGRYGGDEFIAGLQHTPLEGALTLISNLKKNPNAPIGFTSGVVQYDPQKHFGDNSENHYELIRDKIISDASKVCMKGQKLRPGEIYRAIDGEVQAYSSDTDQ